MEALLRPPVELWSALAASATGTVAILAPWALMMPPGLAYAAAAVLFSLALVRARQAARVLRYQRNMRRLPRYQLRADRIPLSRHKLFLGKGFRWTQRHTQRLRDTLRPDVQHYVQPGPLYHWARRKEVAWEATPGLKQVARLLRHPRGGIRSNRFRRSAAYPRCMPLSRTRRTSGWIWVNVSGIPWCLGTTRVGKTRLAEILITQDIRRGDVVIVFDPKGDADLLRRIYAEAKRAGRDSEFYLFHLGFPEVSARYNAIGSFSRITEVATRIANQLPSEGNSAAFKEFAWRFVNIIARALVALGRRPDYQQIRRYINDIEPLFVEYAHAHLQREGTADWATEVDEIAGKISERNLSAALKGQGSSGNCPDALSPGAGPL